MLVWLVLFWFSLSMSACDGMDEAASRNTPFDEPVRGQSDVMLTIDFQEGFRNDTVTISIDGKQVVHEENIETQMLLGVAKSFEMKIAPGERVIEIAVPTQNVKHEMSLNITSDVFIGTSIIVGDLRTMTSDKPFGYM